MITIVRSLEGDWVGVYVGAALVKEGHSIDETDMALIGIKYADTFKVSQLYCGSISDECIERHDYRLPSSLADVAFDPSDPLEHVTS